MYPVYGDYWLISDALPPQDFDRYHQRDYDYYAYDYTDDSDLEYDVYLFWPSSVPQVLVPAHDAEYLGLEVSVLLPLCLAASRVL